VQAWSRREPALAASRAAAPAGGWQSAEDDEDLLVW
jgi:hypothetical protein